MSRIDGLAVGLSISDAPDRGRLGYPEREVRRVCFSVCTQVIRAGGRIVYGGDLRPGGWTLEMFHFVAATYAGAQASPFVHVLPEPGLRRAGFSGLHDAIAAARGAAETWAVLGDEILPVRRREGALTIGPKGSARLTFDEPEPFTRWLEATPIRPPSEAYTAARTQLAVLCAARVAMGGKLGLLERDEDRYEGARPGVLEEAILTLERGRLFVPLGAFGGATRDAAIALGLLPTEARTPRGPQQESYAPALQTLAALADRTPERLRPQLETLASADNAEALAVGTVAAIAAAAAGAFP